MKVAVVGLGTMGRGIAANVAAAGHDLTVWNRSAGTRVAGARRAGTLVEAVTDQDVVLVCLSDDTAVREVVLGTDGVLSSVSAATVVVDMSTISPALSDLEHAGAARRGIAFLDAPVFGSRDEAASAGLWVVVGGDAEVLERVRPVLEAISATVHHLGPAGSGARMKLVGNLLVTAQLQSLGEALTLAAASGLDLARVLDVVDVTDFRTPIYSGVGRAVMAGDYAPAFALRLLQKDVGLIRAHARAVGAPVPGTDAAAGVVDAAVEAGLGDLNASALVQVLAARAGVVLEQAVGRAER